jgi:fatty acid desaturase
MREAGQGRFYETHAGALKRELALSLPRETLRDLHRRRPWLHGLVAAWALAMLGGCTIVLWRCTSPWVWVPAALLQGLVLFNLTVLLHEVVHRTVTRGDHPVLYRLLGLLYSLPTGISATQFTRWHLDHHAGLGSGEEDPKRRHLSPKRNARWLKLLYFTPALFVIYFRAARREAAHYPRRVRRRIAAERWAATLLHGTILGLIAWRGGWAAAARVYLVPVLLVFPVAFALNRLGQHYAIRPGDVSGWSTRMRASRLWDGIFLWSAHHLEHHYFPGVPFYNLGALGTALRPFLDDRKLPERTFAGLLWAWLVLNRPPHAEWE